MNLNTKWIKTFSLFSFMCVFWDVCSTWGPRYFIRKTHKLPKTSTSVTYDLTWAPTLRSRGYPALVKFYPASKTYHVWFKEHLSVISLSQHKGTKYFLLIASVLMRKAYSSFHLSHVTKLAFLYLKRQN